MAKYIDVEKLIEKCHPIIDVSTSIGNIGVTLEEIRAIAPATEVAEVVRCKDCKYSDDGILPNMALHTVCKCDRKLVHNSDFCSWGERRENREQWLNMLI